jgi:hypothetical protein
MRKMHRAPPLCPAASRRIIQHVQRMRQVDQTHCPSGTALWTESINPRGCASHAPLRISHPSKYGESCTPGAPRSPTQPGELLDQSSLEPTTCRRGGTGRMPENPSAQVVLPRFPGQPLLPSACAGADRWIPRRRHRALVKACAGPQPQKYHQDGHHLHHCAPARPRPAAGCLSPGHDPLPDALPHGRRWLCAADLIAQCQTHHLRQIIRQLGYGTHPALRPSYRYSSPTLGSGSHSRLSFSRSRLHA